MSIITNILSQKLIFDLRFIFGLLLLLYLPIISSSAGDISFLSLFGILASLVLFYVYLQQVKYINIDFPQKKLRRQYAFVLFGILVPQIAIFLGDIHGFLAFSDEGLEAPFLSYLVFTPILAAVMLSLVVPGNAIFVKTRGQNRVLYIFGKIISIIFILLISAGSFFLYNFFYSLHDPSTE